VTPSAFSPAVEALGQEMYQLASELFPICRSLTGAGVRQTLQTIGRLIPLRMHEVPSGTAVFDWTVPPEWNIRDAYVADARGHRVVDFNRHNLHVVNYSVPVRARMSRAELDAHLFSLPEKPDWIPYRTAYYERSWGFCLSHRQRLALPEGEYDVVIDSTLEPGHLSYGEYCLPGELPDEILISCHVCHPSLGNDNLSGIALATFLARHVATEPRRYSYRFLFIPGTIGSITWLARNQALVSRIKHGLVLTCVGDAGKPTYKRSRQGSAEIDRAVGHVLRHSGAPFEIQDFIPWGYDERQYCSPGFNLAVGCLMRTPNGRYPEYHTSADDLSLIGPRHLADSFATCAAVLAVLEGNHRCINLNPKCEPQLGRRGLYEAMATAQNARDPQMAMLWVLNLSDGSHSLLDIAERANIPFGLVREAADQLCQHNLLARLTESGEVSQ